MRPDDYDLWADRRSQSDFAIGLVCGLFGGMAAVVIVWMLAAV